MNYFSLTFVNCQLLIAYYFNRGRPVLTGCVMSYASMQAREGRALNTALEPISGENTYAMAA